MVAEQKIEEAEYFLEKITQAATRRDFIPNLSAFLSATRSIPDYLLEDYNVKLGVNIPLKEKLFPTKFEKVATNQLNQNALNFISDYNSKLANIYNDSVAGLLIKKRNIEIHRTDVPIQAKFYRSMSETISITESVSLEVRDKYGNLKVRSEPTKHESKPASQTVQSESPVSSSSASVEWFFTDFKNDNVISVCNTFLTLVKTFINDIKNAYP